MMAHDILDTRMNAGKMDGFVDGWKTGEREGDVTHKINTNPQSGLTPRRLPRSDRPTLDLVSESSSRTVTCMSFIS